MTTDADGAQPVVALEAFGWSEVAKMRQIRCITGLLEVVSRAGRFHFVRRDVIPIGELQASEASDDGALDWHQTEMRSCIEHV